MKTIVLGLLLTCTAFCQLKDYDVNFYDDEDTFTFSVITEKEQPSMGDLVIFDLRIARPEDKIPGVISMDLMLDPNSASLPALGTREGRFIFQKGKDLPEIINGEYEIVIDGTSYGHIQIDDGHGNFFPLKS